MRYGGAVTPVGLRPPFVTAPPQSLILIDAESHLDCRRARTNKRTDSRYTGLADTYGTGKLKPAS